MIPDLFTSFLFSFHLVPGEFYSFLLLDPLFSETPAPPLRNGRSPPLTTEEQDRELQPQEVLNSLSCPPVPQSQTRRKLASFQLPGLPTSQLNGSTTTRFSRIPTPASPSLATSCLEDETEKLLPLGQVQKGTARRARRRNPGAASFRAGGGARWPPTGLFLASAPQPESRRRKRREPRESGEAGSSGRCVGAAGWRPVGPGGSPPRAGRPGGGAGPAGRCAFAGGAASLVVLQRRSPCAHGRGTRWGRPGRGAREGLREGAAHGGTPSFLFPTRRTACLRKVGFQSKLAKSPGIA